MRILLFSDIHNDINALEKLASTPADIYISAGDLVSWARGLPDCGEVLAPHQDKVWVLPGNHESSDQIGKFCERYGFRNFHERVFESNGYHFAGLGYSNPTPFGTPGEYSEEEIEARLARFQGLSPLVLVCHTPPQGTALDEGGAGQHFGSPAVRDFIVREQPAHFFCGHIHEAAGRSDQIGETQGVNVGKKGHLLELESIAS